MSKLAQITLTPAYRAVSIVNCCMEKNARMIVIFCGFSKLSVSLTGSL